MQRRAAAVLFVFFVVMAASAYSVVSLAESPDIQLDGAETYQNGSNFTAGDQEYRVLAQMEESSGGGGGHGGGGGGGPTPAGTLQWYVPETTQNQSYGNGSTAEVFNGTWLVTTGVAPNLENAYVSADGNVTALSAAGQRMDAGGSGNASGNESGNASGGGTPAAGNGTESGGLETNGTAGSGVSGNGTSGANATTTGQNASSNASSNSTDAGGSAGVASSNGTQAAENGSLYTEAQDTLVFTNTTDVTAILESDPAVYNETVTAQGQTFVRYQSNGTFVPIAQYLSPAEQTRVAEGESFELQLEIDTFDGSRMVNVSATVVNVTNSSAVVEYTVPQYNTAELTQGGNVTLANGEQRVVNFQTEGHGNETSISGVQLGQDYSVYAEQADTQASFTDRMTGLWNVIIISSLAGLLVVGLAFLPVRG
ncbi:hypothetical protein [Halomarina oriensis]|uniref:Uncharacterized protein n=1 Tax=Halomarina oriensis TaxID=671145 RepID=A0A6B0GM08_9EURY|nr:hypothetical protein [Halomarina oriensis]MWG34931.1 hypothetical protein [Halomarina oriensis]